MNSLPSFVFKPKEEGGIFEYLCGLKMTLFNILLYILLLLYYNILLYVYIYYYIIIYYYMYITIHITTILNKVTFRPHKYSNMPTSSFGLKTKLGRRFII